MTETTAVTISPDVLELVKNLVWGAGVAISSMAAAFMFIVKWMMTGMDKRDETNKKAVEQLSNAIDQWRHFEEEERKSHNAILTGFENINVKLSKIEGIVTK